MSFVVESHGAGVPLPSLGNNLTVDTANSMPAMKQMTPIMNLHNTKSPGCQWEKYNNNNGIMTQTGTGNAMIALNTLNFNNLSLILNITCR